MTRFETSLLPPSAAIRDAVRKIEESDGKIALVVDEAGRLMGTVTDGDVRRGLLGGVGLDARVSEVMNAAPRTFGPRHRRQDILAYMRQNVLRHMPITDEAGRLVGLVTLTDLLEPEQRDNWVVLLAGGMGRRLRPLTRECPKPMLKIGGRPVLETIVRQLVDQGFHRVYISINYLADVVKEHFGDGAALGAEIRYLTEDAPLGTAGPLSLLPERPALPLVVMNGDILTNVSFADMLAFHDEHRAGATVGVREQEYQVPYGVVEIDDHHVSMIREKPVNRYFVNAGIYVLNPELLDLIPRREAFDMPALIRAAHGRGVPALAFPIREYWVDIGHMDDFVQANSEFPDIFS